MASASVSRCICRNEHFYASTRCSDTPHTPASQHARPQHMMQVTSAAAAAGHAAGPPSMHLFDSSTNSSRYSSCTTPCGTHKQRPLSAASLLERAAAAPRPAAVPEQLEASTSSFSSSACTTAAHAGLGARRVRSTWLRADSHFYVLQPGVAAASAVGAATAVEFGGISDMAHAVSSDHLILDNHPSSSSSSSSNVASNGSCYSVNGRLSQEGLQLMQDIMGQHSWHDLANLIQQQAKQCTAPHCAAALYKLAALWRQQQQCVQQQQPHMRAELRLQYPAVLQVASVLLRAFQQQITAAGFRDLADALSALITLGFQTQQQPQQSVGDGSLAYTANHASSSSSSPLGAAASAEAALPGVISEGFFHDVLQHSHTLLLRNQFKPQQLSRVLWALAQLEVKPHVDWWSVALDAAADAFQQQQQQQQHSPYDQQHDYEQRQRQRPSHNQQPHDQQQQQQQCFSPQGLALTGWAVAKLQAPATAAWWSCYMAAAAAAMSDMEPQHLSNCIWALATAQQVPDHGWMIGFFSESAKYLDLQHVSNSCFNSNNSHNGVQQDRPNTEATTSPRFSPQGLAITLWALAVLQQQPPQYWQQQYDAASAAELPNFSMQHLSMTLWAYGRFSSSGQLWQQQQQPSAGWLDQFWVQLSSVGSEVTAQSVACIVWGLVKVGAAVPPHRGHQLDVLVCEVLRDATFQGLAIIVWAMGIIRGSGTSRKVIQHIRYYCLNNQQQLSTQLTPQGLVMLLSGLSRFKAWQPDSLKQQLLTAVMQRLLLDPPSSSSSGGGGGGGVSRSGFKACELPVVLLSLVQLRIVVPTAVLETTQELLLQRQQQHNSHQQQQQPSHQQQQQRRQLDGLTTGQLSVCLYALGLAKHHPSEALLQAAAAAVQAAVCNMGYRDVAFVLYGLAAMTRASGQQQQQQQQVEAVLQQLIQRAHEVLDQCDHKCLAMIMWSLAALQLRPSDAFLQHCLAVTTAQLPNMTLLSVTTVLTSLQTMQYLPPVHWMVATCKAARLKVNSDKTAKPYQRRACVRRLEGSIAWYNNVLAQQQQQRQQQPSGSGVQRRLSDAVLKGAASVLGSGNTSSEAVIAAAVGVAAAVAQQWRW